MLDWMKKLLNKEEKVSENFVMPEAKQTNEMETERKIEQSSYPNGKFRFPLILDETIRSVSIPQEKEQEERKKEKQVPINRPYIAPSRPVHKKERVDIDQTPIRPNTGSSFKKINTNQHSFQPTETVSPVFGYERPNEDLWKKKPPADLVLSRDQMPVVDAWLFKNGYFVSSNEDAVQVDGESQEKIENGSTGSFPVKPSSALLEQHRYFEEETLEDTCSVKEEVKIVKDAKPANYTQGEVEELLNERKESTAEPIDVEQEEVRVTPIEQQIVKKAEPAHDAQREVEELSNEWEESAAEPTDIEQEEVRVTPREQQIVKKAEPAHDTQEKEEELLNERKESAAEPTDTAQEEMRILPAEEQTVNETELVNSVIEETEALSNEQKNNKPDTMSVIGQETESGSCNSVQESAVEDNTKPSYNTGLKNKKSLLPNTENRNNKKRENNQSEQKIPYNVVMLHQDRLKVKSLQGKEHTYSSAYRFPPLALLNIPNGDMSNDEEWIADQEQLLNTTFENFHIGAKVVHVTQGPAVTRFEVQPDPGVKVNKITNLSDDIKLNLAARDIRIEAPIPGKNTIGIEVPNRHSKPVFLREILRSPVFTKSGSSLTVALGLDISGMPIVTDLCKMPHGLIAGATGSGKSVCINAILTSILYKAMPHEVKLLLIDPKMVELAPYNDVPHLVSPVITDVKAATAALKWAVEEMEHRYELFAHAGVRDLSRYNDAVKKSVPGEPLPYIVIVIDELADLMMVSPADVEEAICRIAQKARACGIHLLIATQRPSVDVITGLIKANVPTRLAFTVSSQVDSRTIIDISGAEKLLGRGDMLFLENGTSKPIRIQGVYVSDEEIERTVEHVRKQMKPQFLFKQDDLLAKLDQHETEDDLFFEACQFILDQGGASTSSLQRRFHIGYNRAARLIEEMEMQGIISGNRGTKPRDVLISEDELMAMQERE